MKIYSRLRSKPKKRTHKGHELVFCNRTVFSTKYSSSIFTETKVLQEPQKEAKKTNPPRTETYAKQLQTRINSRENKSVPVDPVGVLGIELHELIEKDMRDWGHSHRRTGMARVRIRDRISLSKR